MEEAVKELFVVSEQEEEIMNSKKERKKNELKGEEKK